MGIQSYDSSTQTCQQSLVMELLQPLLTRRRPKRLLLLQHAAAEPLPVESGDDTQVILLTTDQNSTDIQVQCRLEALPFEPESFELVILHQLVADGSEPLAREAIRVLAPGGDLLISGLNSAGLHYRIKNGTDRFPGLKVNRIIEQLKTESFDIVHTLRMGLAGLARPTIRNNWNGLSMPFADYVVLHCHHQSDIHNVRTLRFKHTPGHGVSSTALDGVSSRKAAS